MTDFLFVNMGRLAYFSDDSFSKGNSLELPPRLPPPPSTSLTSAFKNDDTDPVPEISQGIFLSSLKSQQLIPFKICDFLSDKNIRSTTNKRRRFFFCPS